MRSFRHSSTFAEGLFVYARQPESRWRTQTVTANPFSFDLAFLNNEHTVVRPAGGAHERRSFHAGRGGMHGAIGIEFVEVAGPSEYVEITPSAALREEVACALKQPQAAELADCHALADPVLWAASVRVRAHATGGWPLDSVASAELLHALTAHMMVTYLGAKPPRENARQLDRAKLMRLTDYIEAHLADEIRLEELAALAFLSPFHFIRAFRATTGLTPYQFILARRMERARQAVFLEGQTVTAAAEACGYQNAPHFRRAFQRFFGVQPSAYTEHVTNE